MSEGPARPPPPPSPAPKVSPPHVEVDSSPLHTTMDKNKESLKVKLMMRRPINQLVAQGIIPSLKTPPAFHEQRQKLERAKTGDLLKAKIQRRPDRDELVRQHILDPDMGHVDPSLAEKQRMLKKARLADSLNDQLSHRPGPLELIQKNILHTDEPIERAVKEGVIPFKATSEGLRKAHHPDHYVTFDEDSLSSDNSQNSLPTLEPIRKPRDVIETAAASAGIVTVAVLQPLPAELCSPLSLCSSTSSLSPLSSVASPPTPLTPRPPTLASPAPGKADKNRKKSKTKALPKARTIKFHEYKGPPSAQKTLNLNNNSNETSYELLLQQQQLFLQWQLEWQHKYPQIILPAPATPKPQPEASVSSLPATATLVVTSSPSPAPPSPPQLPPLEPPKYEDMKVSDLKEELKRRNLPRSGPKPQLIERLRGKSSLSESSEMEGCESNEDGKQMSPSPPSPDAMDTTDPTPPPSPQNGDFIIAQQQRKIEELQRELQRSQQQLQKMQRGSTPAVPPPVATVAPVTVTRPTPLTLPTAIPLKAVLQNGVLHIDSKKLLVHHQVPAKAPTTSTPNNVNVKASLAARITQHQAQQQLNQLLKNKIFVPVEVKPKQPPPVYEEATKAVKQEVIEQKNVKSQVVDDLLDILIRSGELPPSAAQGPITPTSAPSVPPMLVAQKTVAAFPEPAPYPGPYIENMATDFQEVSNNNIDHNFHSNCLDFLLNQDVTSDYNNANGNVTLKDLGLDLETLDSMDFGQLEEGSNNNCELPVAMEMDDAWLGYMSNSEPSPSEMRPYDPLLCTNQQPFDLFNLEDTDLKLTAMSWDKVDFAA